MKLALASDLHFELYKDNRWLPPISGIEGGDAPDILVLAGDIGVEEGAIEAVERLGATAPRISDQ